MDRSHLSTEERLTRVVRVHSNCLRQLQEMVDVHFTTGCRAPQWRENLEVEVQSFVDALTKPLATYQEEGIRCLRMFTGEVLAPHAHAILKAVRGNVLRRRGEALALLQKLDNRGVRKLRRRIAKLLADGSPDVRYEALRLLHRVPADRLLPWAEVIAGMQAEAHAHIAEEAAWVMHRMFEPGGAGFQHAQAEFEQHVEPPGGKRKKAKKRARESVG